ncbi:MAG: alanine racemase [Gammaproteobacteria bacterium]
MTRPVRATINTAALAYNLSIAKVAAPNSKIMAVIKADGYGHGIVEVAKALADADAFAVASLDEALTLIDSGIQTPLVLLEGIFDASELQLAIDHNIEITLHDHSQLHWIQQANLNASLSAWIKFDTGMHRLGFDPADYDQLIQAIDKMPSISSALGLMSHFACADEPERIESKQQSDIFESLAIKHSGKKSLANSAGLLSRDNAHYDWVRPGIMLYGSSPFAYRDAYPTELKPVMSLTTQLIAVRQVKKGEAIGYGGNCVCEKDTTVGVAAIGYGDGYPRHAPTGMPVYVNAKRCYLVGRVSMDMITIDLAHSPHAQVGDEVELWGECLSVNEVADFAGTISYELFCNITPRVKRYYQSKGVS